VFAQPRCVIEPLTSPGRTVRRLARRLGGARNLWSELQCSKRRKRSARLLPRAPTTLS